jgi:hypothetical protein
MTFRAPVRELAFALKTAGFEALLESGQAQTDFETVQAILQAAGDFSNEVLAPLNRAGDQIGATYANGKVTSVPGFAAAYQAFARDGWTSLTADPAHGGQGLPKAVELAVAEMVQSANMAFGLCPMLSLAAIEALSQHGTERQKTLVLPKLVSGEWTGAMVLTEPQAGTDLAALHPRQARRPGRLPALRPEDLHHLGRPRHDGQPRPSGDRPHAGRPARGEGHQPVPDLQEADRRRGKPRRAERLPAHLHRAQDGHPRLADLRHALRRGPGRAGRRA